MSYTIPIEQESAELRGLVRGLKPGDEIVLTDNEKPVARIILDVATGASPRKRVAGASKGLLTIVQEDDEHLEDFKEYMP
jgi:antitoxin (DNA-binding transcriptional repressor) of toxin-antitoxin stability system